MKQKKIVDEIALPDDFVEEVKNLFNFGELLEIEVEIEKQRLKDCIAKYDKEGAYRARLELRRLVGEMEKNHDERWEFLGKILPETKSGSWNLNTMTWTVTRSAKPDLSGGISAAGLN